MILKIKPLSINACFKGRRFKTPTYNQYEKDLFEILPYLKIPDGKLKVSLIFGLSSKLADIDNPVKAFVDILQKYYNFNDRDIFEMHLKKENVKKGDEFINFNIEKL